MQAQYMIIFAGALLGVLALAYFIRRAFLRTLARATADYRDRNHALSSDLARTAERCQSLAAQATEHQAQQQQLKAQPFTVDDQQTLIRMAQALELATKTFKALKAEDAHAKAAALIPQARELAYRVFHTATAGAALNTDSLDTRLIEWLNTHGSFWAEPENSIVTFPHEAETEGYPHLRDALREAYERHQQRQASDWPWGDVA
ncbi:hypothetical protein ACI2KO_11960 [Pseudomonas piscis]|uniref:hypothetical protein n=1 Tax=Pseudomonas piscis TaxID=2614538 RepID=UPI003850C112